MRSVRQQSNLRFFSIKSTGEWDWINSESEEIIEIE